MYHFIEKPTTNSEAGNEFMVSGDSIHASWQYAWPKVIARAWHIEYLLLKTKNLTLDEINCNTVNQNGFYEQLRNKITNTLKDQDKTIRLLEEIGALSEDNKKECSTGRNKFLECILDNRNINKLKLFYEKILEDITLKNQELEVNGKRFKIDDTDFKWFKKLLCHKSEMVLDALKDEGFIVNAMENPPIDFDRHCTTRIIVRKPNQPYQVEEKRTPRNTYNRESSSNDRVSIGFKPGKNPNSIPADQRIEKFSENLTETFSGLGQEFHGSGKKINGSRINGWRDAKGLGHVLVVTLPTPPDEPSEYGLAIAEYEAAGKVYSFTCCT